jgi:probable HAF family extracellular repeat protein
MICNLNSRLFGLIASLYLGTAVAGFAITEYSIIDLGFLGSGFARARAINEQGQIVGESLLPGGALIEHAFISQAGSMADLGTLGGDRSRAYDINRNGTIGGWAQNASGKTMPALWNGNSVTALPTLGGTSGGVWAINDAGVAVGNSSLSGNTQSHATLWADGKAGDLGTLGGQYSVAYDINNRGIAVGSAFGSSGLERACLWGADEPVDLGSLDDGQWTAARGINDSGQVILWGTPSGEKNNHATFWTGDSLSPVIDLGTLGGSESWAYGLNNLGYVVGAADVSVGSYHAFVWDGVEKIDLGTLGGYYSTAFGINDQGIIVGFAHDASGDTHAVEWIPVPEPAPVQILAVAGLIGVLTRCRRHRQA